MKLPPCPPGTNTNIASGLGILHALQERREIGIHQGHLDLFDDFTAGGGEARLEKLQRVVPGA